MLPRHLENLPSPRSKSTPNLFNEPNSTVEPILQVCVRNFCKSLRIGFFGASEPTSSMGAPLRLGGRSGSTARTTSLVAKGILHHQVPRPTALRCQYRSCRRSVGASGKNTWCFVLSGDALAEVQTVKWCFFLPSHSVDVGLIDYTLALLFIWVSHTLAPVDDDICSRVQLESHSWPGFAFEKCVVAQFCFQSVCARVHHCIIRVNGRGAIAQTTSSVAQ